MAIKDILLALTTYPQPTADTAVKGAVAIAAALDANIAALACEVKVKLPSSLLASAMIDLPGIAAAEARKSAAAAEHLLGLFSDEARKRGVNGGTISEQAFSADVPEMLTKYARFRDLTIMPVPEGDEFDQWYAESVIFGSGRPALIIPHDWKRRETFQLNTAVVAWDLSRPAARAVADAIPLLQKVSQVYVVSVAGDKDIDQERSAVELARHLAHHRIEVTVETVDSRGQDVGSAIAAHCASRNADLLVMGAYGHSRIRQFIFGGATRSMLARPTLPVLMSH
jgi:nucleotide-binding universal stress UspA family protein